MKEPDGRLVGIIAHTATNPTRRYFEDHRTRTPRWHARGGETRAWSELIDPEVWTPGREVRP